MLDQDQQTICDLKEGFFSIQASPGSGKSRLLLHRTAALAKENDPKEILCLTFTAEASRNLRSRSQKEFPWLDTSVFSTLHALGLKFAHENASAYPFELNDNPLAGEGVAAKAVFEATRNKINYQAFTSWVSLQKRNRITPQEALSIAEKSGKNLDYAIGFKLYAKALEKLGCLDYDDLLSKMADVLETRPDIRSRYQFKHVLVDEVQDLSKLDWELIQLFTQKYKNATVVGDPNQSIYNFRGGDPHYFLEMEKYFPGTQKYFLNTNYRSSPEIVDYVKKAAPHQEIASHMRSFRSNSGPVPHIQGFSAEFLEAEFVIQKAQELGPDNCVVLARTNLMLRSCEEEAINKGVKYHLLGDSGYWTQPEILNVLSYVRCCINPSDNAVLGALRSPFHPSKYVKKKVVADETKIEIEKTGKTAWEILKNNPKTSDFINFIRGTFNYKHLPATEAVSNIIRELKCVSHFKEEEGLVPDRDPIANLRELVKVSGKYDSLNQFLDFVRRVQGASRNRKGLCLSTIHGFKGREMDNVFVISANSGTIPHAKSDNLEEEKRIWYTALSRPKDQLFISWWGAPSEFLL